MRTLVYGTQSLITSDAVSRALLALTAGLATQGVCEVVTIPVMHHDRVVDIDLVIGDGLPVMSKPELWPGEDPDFSDAVARLQLNMSYPHTAMIDPYAPEDDGAPWGHDDDPSSIDLF